MRQWTRSLLNFFYPNRCPACGAFLTAHLHLCDACAEALLLPQDGYCTSCGMIPCRCASGSFEYDRAVICSPYAKGAVNAILHLKRSTNTNFAYYAAGILAARLKDNPVYRQIDCVMPVPMHPEKQRSRGYNQAALIAAETARLLGLPCREDVLFKRRGNAEQHTLGAQARTSNVDSFGIHDCRLDGMRILLCDDVLTTGSTMNRCAALLKQQGASAVIAAAATTTIPKPLQEETI